jgi:MFS family permease
MPVRALSLYSCCARCAIGLTCSLLDRQLTTLCARLRIINAFLPTFTWVCFTSLISGILTGLTGSASKALLADCVPIDVATGKPFAPAKDYMVMSYSSVLPRLILPGILGVVFDSFSSPSLAYKWFFLTASGLHLSSSFLYLKVKQTQVEAKARRENSELGTAKQARAGSPPLGAKLCDMLLFGNPKTNASAPLLQ